MPTQKYEIPVSVKRGNAIQCLVVTVRASSFEQARKQAVPEAIRLGYGPNVELFIQSESEPTSIPCPIAVAVRAAIEAAKADPGCHTNERIYQNGYIDGLEAALELIQKGTK